MLENMSDFRCPRCNKLFFKYKLKGELVVEVKCTRCSTTAFLEVNRR